MNDIDIKNSLDRLLEKHERAVLLFSGGKDSLAVLNLCRDYLDRILVLHLDTGEKLPHMQGFVEKSVERLGGSLKVIFPEISQRDSFKTFGLPASILPFRKTAWFKDFGKNFVKLQSHIECCTRLRWNPMSKFALEYRPTLVIGGQRKEDHVITPQNGMGQNGVEWFLPIDTWTCEEVMNYLHRNRVPVTPLYPLGAMDCWNCTAIWPDTESIKNLIFLKDNYPARYKTLVDCLKAIHGVVRGEVEQFGEMLNETV